ncbi:hypothetical protein P168DRAFT_287609 [Aspergillus campestris IBT 28561]|uniref:SMODS and SLOG-associating 2TM effector domain-containing protein n=1 Tax=Aspergillus campestris (strain IBT 28561) TaxID=1392248 RepID=A0A2I1DB70_ASPC2|nr:uncharacterized protein P168DRAFT_287609 [Aspergillus campestris IBT 28561]PKY07115.1 hypothetical protein P168DRAFT_287609 [Aspergillus campestris IBT 28561]
MAEYPTRRSLARRLLTAFLDHHDSSLPTTHPPPPPGVPPMLQMNNESCDSRPKLLTIARTDQSTLIPPQDKLLMFRALMGIENVPALTTLHHYQRTIQNVGIYTRVVRAEETAAQRYRLFSILINTCLGVQIVVAAALTALGAAAGPHSAVTTFGAINTIVAGVLTYLKGSGLPDRLKHYQNEWGNIREYIEQRERELCLDGCILDVHEEILFIEHLYEGVKREIESTKSGGENRSTAQDRHIQRSFLPPQQRQQEQQQQSPDPNGQVTAPDPALVKEKN